MNCPKCNRPVADESRFCNHCGQPLIDALIGSKFGNYRIARLLGSGGFAKVYLGEHIDLHTQVAVKVLKNPLDDDEQFKQEARTIAGLKHQHIVRLLDYGKEGNTPYLLMEYAPNGSLRQRHDRGKPLPLGTILLYIKQLADALQYAHSEKLIHRDIKPENMLVSQNNDVLLTDFGIAVIAQSSGHVDSQIAGTYTYMAPEQFQGKPRPASDIYSLGVVLYEWLCGELPFQGSYREVGAQHMLKPPPPLREKVPGIPPALEEVVMTALAKDPKERFATISALANAFEREVESKTSGALSPGNALPDLRYLPTQRFPGPAFSPAAPPTPPPEPGANAAVPGNLPADWLNLPTQMGRDFPPPDITMSPPEPSAEPMTIGTTICQYPGHKQKEVQTLAWIHEGKQILSSGADQTVQVWESSGDSIHTFIGHGVVVAPNQERAAIIGRDQKSIHIVDLTAGRTTQVYPEHQSPVTALAWSPDSQRIASGVQDNGMRIWDAISGHTIDKYRLHGSAVSAVVWSPDGKRVASADTDGQVRVRTVGSASITAPYSGHTEKVHHLFWPEHDMRIISASRDGTVHIWDAGKLKKLASVGNQAKEDSPLALSPDGAYVASVSVDQAGMQTLQVWSSTTGILRAVYRDQKDAARAIAWSPDGQRIASAGKDGTVHIWDANTGKNQFIYEGHKGALRAVAWSPDGKWLASAGQDREVHIWSAEQEISPPINTTTLSGEQFCLLTIAVGIFFVSAILAIAAAAGWVFILGLFFSGAIAYYVFTRRPMNAEATKSDDG